MSMVIIHKSVNTLKETSVQLYTLIEYMKELEDSDALRDQIEKLKSDIDKSIKDLNEYEKDLEYADKPHYSEFEREDPIRNDTIAPITINSADKVLLAATIEQYEYLEYLYTQEEYLRLLKFKPLTRRQASILIEAKKSSVQ